VTPTVVEAAVNRWYRPDHDESVTFNMRETLEAALAQIDQERQPTDDGVIDPLDISDEVAERFCALVNWNPDGRQGSVVEGEMRVVSFRHLARGYVAAALTASQIGQPLTKYLGDRHVEG